jgi:hypothetical protein
MRYLIIGWSLGFICAVLIALNAQENFALGILLGLILPSVGGVVGNYFD